MGFSQEDESEKPEAAWENPVLVIVRGIKYNESYKMLTGGICMGSYLNPGNEAFAVALNSEIYVDKTGLLTYTNKVMNTTAARGGLENQLRQTCSPRITARAAVRKKCFPGWKSAGQRILKNI
jgi:hypothetical protein